jgi:predicted heme/steroid binding protein
MSNSVTPEEVSKHNSEKNGVWIVIDNNVYDMSSLYGRKKKSFLGLHVLVLTNILEERKSLFVLQERMLANR